MRMILGITLLLLGVGLMSCRIEGRSTEATSRAEESDWVRTADGWERAHDWRPSLVAPPAVHPLVVAAAQVLVSMLALVIASVESPVRRDEARQSIRPPRFVSARVPAPTAD